MIKKIRDNFRVYLERAHPAFLTTIVVLVIFVSSIVGGIIYIVGALHRKVYIEEPRIIQ